jgi:hypothetical protein
MEFLTVLAPLWVLEVPTSFRDRQGVWFFNPTVSKL